MIHTGIGFSQEPSISYAAREAALQAKTQTKQKKIDLAVVLTTPRYSSLETLHTIRQTLSDTKIIGCSTGAVILPESVEKQGVAVLALCCDDFLSKKAFVQEINPQNARIAGNELARNLIMDFGQGHRNGLLLFVDGLLPNTPGLIRGIQEILGKAFPIVGAGASDFFQFKQSFQHYQNTPLTHSAIGLLLGGHLHLVTASRHGFKPLGKPRIADKTHGEIIKEIDGKKAANIYEEYFSMDFRMLRSDGFIQNAFLYPLGIRAEGWKDYSLRTAAGILDDGSILCRGEVPQESEIHIMMTSKEFCQEAAAQAAQDLKAALGSKTPSLVFVFSSLSHYKLFSRQAFEEIKVIKDVLGPSVPLYGMYSYGEIASFDQSLYRGGEAELLSQTITTCAVV